MNFFMRLYKLYKEHVADIILVVLIFFLVYLIKYIPYLNIFILNFDPVLSGIVVAWIIFYLILKPEISKIIMWALLIFIINYFFLIFNQSKIGEIFASLTYAMLFTAVILEVKKLKNQIR